MNFIFIIFYLLVIVPQITLRPVAEDHFDSIALPPTPRPLRRLTFIDYQVERYRTGVETPAMRAEMGRALTEYCKPIRTCRHWAYFNHGRFGFFGPPDQAPATLPIRLQPVTDPVKYQPTSLEDQRILLHICAQLINSTQGCLPEEIEVFSRPIVIPVNSTTEMTVWQKIWANMPWQNRTDPAPDDPLNLNDSRPYWTIHDRIRFLRPQNDYFL